MGTIRLRINISDILFLAAMVLAVAFPQPSNYKAIAIIVFFGYTVVVSFGRGINTKNALQYCWAIVFGGYCYFSKTWSVLPSAADEVLNNILWSLLLSVAIVNYVVMNKLEMEDLIKRVVFVALAFLLNVLLNGVYYYNRFTLVMGDYFLNENGFGQIASSFACFFLLWCKKRGWKKLWLLILMAVLIVLGLLSGSRRILIALGLYLIMFLLYEYPPTDFVKFFMRPLVIVFIAGVMFLCVMNIESLYTAVGSRIESAFQFFGGDNTADGSASTRIRMIETAWEMFREKPIFGHGLNVFSKTTIFGAYAHNNYMELLSNVGLAGLLLYYVPILVYFKNAYLNWRRGYSYAVLPLAFIGVFLVNDLGMVSYTSIFTHAFLALVIGLNINIGTEREKSLTLPAN